MAPAVFVEALGAVVEGTIQLVKGTVLASAAPTKSNSLARGSRNRGRGCVGRIEQRWCFTRDHPGNSFVATWLLEERRLEHVGILTEEDSWPTNPHGPAIECRKSPIHY